MTESKVTKDVALETKAVEPKAKIKVIKDTTEKVAVAGALGFATGFMTVMGSIAAQKMIDKFEEHKTKKMFKKAEKNGEVHYVGELVSTEEVED